MESQKMMQELLALKEQMGGIKKDESGSAAAGGTGDGNSDSGSRESESTVNKEI